MPQADDIKECWLAYAKRLLTDQGHRGKCSKLGGPPTYPGVDDGELRWPGYLGEDYRSGGVMCVGKVHRNFASDGLPESYRDRLVNITRQWRDGKTSPDNYLAEVREVYRAGFERWGVFRHLRGRREDGGILDTIGVPLTAIAYVNAARCQYPQPNPRGVSKSQATREKEALVSCCLNDYPLSRLAEFLRPKLVLFMCTQAYDNTHLRKDILTICFNMLVDGQLERELSVEGPRFPKYESKTVWAPPVGRFWRACESSCP